LTKRSKAERREKNPDYVLTKHFEGGESQRFSMVIGDSFNISFDEDPNGKDKIRLETMNETDVLLTFRFDSGRLMYLLLERKNG